MTMIKRLFFAVVPLFLAGCLMVGQNEYKLDAQTGIFESTYHDIRSEFLGSTPDKEEGRQSDWKQLKEMTQAASPDFDANVIENVSRGLFAEDKVLSGKKVYKVKCPACFPSKAALLTMLHSKEDEKGEWHFEAVNDETLLVIPSGKKVVATNGTLLKTPNNNVIVWPSNTVTFEYRVDNSQVGGESLLPFYLQENKKEK